ncbi:NACHT domain-containing protein [Trichocoleus sp. FACHB-90]|uniref:NACHT domain-containing protein n=1 Tax=Cyanophyceae TaxID=3028117 RepID=UPI001683989D|nr:NACHT domain-containing protein [Trichocoleus sp. FACHB-90]MBD1929193.1 NACHT domain-containing protein [Trichocoleus sp. FACHB-90]
MAEIRNRNSVQVNEAGKQKLIEAKAAKRIHGDYQDSIWTYWNIAKAASVSEKTVKRFFAGQSVDCDTAIAIATALNLELAELIDPKESNPPDAKPENPIDWRDICHKMLAEQLRRYQFRRQATGTGLGHEVGIYVPLGLVKPTTQPRRSEEFCPSPDEGSSQYQLNEKEIEKRFEADAFLREVIEAGEGKTIAIIGEPGAGKSTWLEQIARHLKDSENVSQFPICIQLGSLDGKTLEEYLLQVWLKEALSLQGMVVSAQMETELMQLFNSHQVWLLLDGVDEIRGDTSTGAISPLQGIANQLRGWVAQAQILLTCRLNVWQANDRVVPNCDIYRTLDFDDPQVGEFIGEWFAKAGKPQLGKQLREKLGESGRERIRDLIRNPLRLALLCQTWVVKQGELPKTKATLYQRFREDFYEWKPHPLLIEDLDKQNELHEALGKLALEAIEKKLPLRKRFAYKVMGKSLFKLACDVGWLNEVYKDAETDEDVYAFYHLTFQEYFAACAISDWGFFLPREHKNRPVEDKNNSGEYKRYRLFEPQWKEVILLWLGIVNNKFKNQKDKFIKILLEFEDGCQHFYGHRAYSLAIDGSEEFLDYKYRNNLNTIMETAIEDIEDETVKYKLQLSWNSLMPSIDIITHLKYSSQPYKFLFNLLKHLGVNVDGLKMDKLRALDSINALISMVRDNQLQLPHTAATIQKSDNLKLEVEYLGTSQNIFVRRLALIRILEIACCEPTTVITALTEVIHTSSYEDISYLLAWIVKQINLESAEGIRAMTELMKNSNHIFLRQEVFKKLQVIDSDNLFQEIVIQMKNWQEDRVIENDSNLCDYFYKLTLHCAQNISYPAFYKAWHNLTSTHSEIQEIIVVDSQPSTQRLNLANFPQLLNAAIANNSNLNDTIHLICIDSSKFENPDNPASEIYAEMVMQGCPERQNGEPETMQALKVYCQLKCQGIFLIFYEDTSGEPPQGFSQTFLTSLSKFHNARRICVVSEQPCNVQTFSPSQPNLVADIVSWVREKMMEE